MGLLRISTSLLPRQQSRFLAKVCSSANSPFDFVSVLIITRTILISFEAKSDCFRVKTNISMASSLCKPCETTLKLLAEGVDALQRCSDFQTVRHIEPGVCSLCDLILQLIRKKHRNLRVPLYWEVSQEVLRRCVWMRPELVYLRIWVPVPLPDGSRLTKFFYSYYLLVANANTPVIRESGSPEALSLVKAWFDECSAYHDCPGGETPEREPELPSRVLQLDTTQPANEVRLITSHGRKGTYAALSYCWGSPDYPPPKTTIDSLERIQSPEGRAIGIDTLPATFRDAIALAKHLGLKYLWIDSLCIVQDSESDWEQEASKMGDYFSNAQLVIGASSSDSPWKGMLEPYIAIPNVELPFFDRFGSPTGTVRVFYYEKFNSVAPWYRNTPIARRGWTLQETVLAQRLVVFTESTTLWRCSETCCDDVGGSIALRDSSDENPFSRLISHAGTPDLGNDFWNWVLTSYSARVFTFSKDKMPALKGLCDRYKERMGAPVWFGLRSDHLLEDLHWYREDNHGVPLPVSNNTQVIRPTPGQAKPPAIPTWSWLSIDEKVTYSHIAAVSERRLDGSTGDWKCTVQATHEPGELACEGPIGLTRIEIRGRHPWPIRSTKGAYLGEAHFCRQTVGSDQFYCLVTQYDCGLILQPVHKRPRHFTRVGIAYFPRIGPDDLRGSSHFTNVCKVFLV